MKIKLPSTFLCKTSVSKMKERVFTYDQDIIYLPMSCGSSSKIAIPKSCANLAKNGLIRKIGLTSNMTIFDEIRSVFRGPMGNRFALMYSNQLVVPANP